jgi:hypothetical protein
MKQQRIILAGHLQKEFGSVPYPFYEVVRTNKKHKSRKKNYVSSISGSKYDPEKFSEYPALWSAFPLRKNIECFGLFHYRCILNLSPNHGADSLESMNLREQVLSAQSEFVGQHRDVLAVSKPLDFTFQKMSNWDQLLFCIPDIEFDLVRMCKVFDSITGLSSEAVLRETAKLYARNIFVGPIQFANSWNRVSFEVLKGLKESEFASNCDRPGGYVLERLFSVYVENWKLTHEVVERPYIWFEQTDSRAV